jgi:8-oxo-dGTP pyrophosphatase MutT (NUDIX family)
MYQKLYQYEPVNEQEQADKALMIQYIERNDDVLERSNLAAHLTSSAIVVNPAMDKVLFAHHNIYQSYGWVGGHNDGDPDCLKVAIKEAQEETGISNIVPYTDDIIGIDVIYVFHHIKNGTYVPDHLHLNVTYLLIASEDETPTPREGENTSVRWFELGDALNHITEERMRPIYQKLFRKVTLYRNK